MKRSRFGFWTLTFLVVANMAGAGVFTTSGYALADLGSPRLVLAAWLVGGLIALAGASSYGRLAAIMPESGGEYLFLSRAAHPLLGFLAGWVSLLAGFSGAIAFAATALEEYVRPSWAAPGETAVWTIVAAGVLHGFVPGTGARLQNALVALKLLVLVGIVLVAARGLPEASPEASGPSGWPLASAFAGSLVWISLSYSGFNAAVYVAGEVPGARKIVPRALLAGTALVTGLYLLLNAVFVYADPERVAGRADVAVAAVQILGGPTLAAVVRWTIAACLLTSVLSMMMAAPHVYAQMADDGFLPWRLGFRQGELWRATTLQTVLSLWLVVLSDLQGLLSYLGLTLSLSSAATVACLFLPGLRTRPVWHPVHWPPTIYLAGTLTAAVTLVSFQPWQAAGTVATFAAGGLVYLLIRKGDGERGQRQTRTVSGASDSSGRAVRALLLPDVERSTNEGPSRD